MPEKTWTLLLDGAKHLVTFEYSLLTGWEKLTVDNQVIASGIRWTILSRYRFSINQHTCEATLRVGMTELLPELTVDGQPFELLPGQSLLRPSSREETASNQLLRAANDPGSSRPEELLRPDEGPKREV